MRTFKTGLIVVMMVCAASACGSDSGGFPGLSTTNQADGPSESPTTKGTTRSPTSRPTGGGGGDWSSLYSENFTTGCLSTSNNNTKYCECALSELQAKFSQADMNAFDQEYARTNKLPPELQSTVQTCVNRG
jgi:hypothetical protein